MSEGCGRTVDEVFSGAGRGESRPPKKKIIVDGFVPRGDWWAEAGRVKETYVVVKCWSRRGLYVVGKLGLPNVEPVGSAGCAGYNFVVLIFDGALYFVENCNTIMVA